MGFEDGIGDPRTAVVSATRCRLMDGHVNRHSRRTRHRFFAATSATARFSNLAAVLQEFRMQLSSQQYLTFNPGYAMAERNTPDSSKNGGLALRKE